LTLPTAISVVGELLQWGRDRAVAEFKSAGLDPKTVAKLQWGRDRAVAELPQ